MHDDIDPRFQGLDDYKVDLSLSTAPNREERLGVAIKNYYGTMSDLIKGTKEKTIMQPERCFDQAGACQLSNLAQRVISIRDAVLLTHSPIGCSAAQHLSHELMRNIPVSDGRPADYNLHSVSTNITEKEIVYGGTDKLRRALKEVDERYHPKAIFVLTSCASGIIGDDVDGTIADVQPEVKAKIAPIHCEGFRSRVLQTGYDAMWHAILKFIVEPPKQKQPDLVNITNMFSYTWRDKAELTRLLGKLGLRANFVPEFASVHDLEIMSEAAVTAPLCITFGDYVMRGLEQQYGVPYFEDVVPMGIHNTDEWLRKVAHYTGKEDIVEKVIEEEHAILKPKFDKLLAGFEEVRKRLKPNGEKLTAIGAVGQGRVLAHAGYLNELGFEVTGACTVDYDSLATDVFDGLIKDVGDFVVLVSTFQAADYVNLFHNLDPDLILQAPFKGGKFDTQKAMATIHFIRGDNHPSRTQVGYVGAVAYGNMCLQAFKNMGLSQTIMDNSESPYKSWWLDVDPLYFVKDTYQAKKLEPPKTHKGKGKGKACSKSCDPTACTSDKPQKKCVAPPTKAEVATNG